MCSLQASQKTSDVHELSTHTSMIQEQISDEKNNLLLKKKKV